MNNAQAPLRQSQMVLLLANARRSVASIYAHTTMCTVEISGKAGNRISERLNLHFFFLGGGGWNIPLHPLVCSTSEGLTFLSVHTPSKPHVTTTARSNKSLFYPSRGRNSLWFT